MGNQWQDCVKSIQFAKYLGSVRLVTMLADVLSALSIELHVKGSGVKITLTW
jgi:hypothetical protein